MDFSAQELKAGFSQPEYLVEAKELVGALARKSEDELSSLMGISSKLASLNHQRYRDFEVPFTKANSKQALLAYKGDVYLGFELDSYTDKDFAFAQDHLRILSGLYGLLKPLDLIQAYRLEMRIKLANEKGKNLYSFWGDALTEGLNVLLAKQEEKVLINLASKEYFKAVRPKVLEGRIVAPVFKEYRNGKLKVIAFLAKKARGLMANYIVRNRITKVEDLKKFDLDGYSYDASLSSEKEWLFVR